MTRHFVRCTGCLEVAAVDLPDGERPPFEYGRPTLRCGICDHAVEYMGRVERDRLLQDHERCACDERYTSARGPICVCRCNGKNHGAGMLAVIRYTTDHGKAPILEPRTEHRRRLALERWQAFSAAVAPLRAELDRLLDRRRAGEFLPPPVFARLCDLRRFNRDIDKARTHDARLRKIAALRGDRLPTGETQARLPGPAGAVREQECRLPPIAPTPAQTFTLTPPAETDPTQTTLF